MPDFPQERLGDIPTPSVGPIEGPFEDAIVGTNETNINEPLREDDAATEYFASVPESEALNYIGMLRDGNFITLERLEQLKALLESTDIQLYL